MSEIEPSEAKKEKKTAVRAVTENCRDTTCNYAMVLVIFFLCGKDIKYKVYV